VVFQTKEAKEKAEKEHPERLLFVLNKECDESE
jgi:hypothetical protein